MIDKQAIGERLKEYRELKNYNQKEFANYLDISQQTLSQIETGTIKISLELLVKVTSKFEITFDWLLHGRGEMERKKVSYETNLAGSDLSAAEPEPNYPRNKPASYEAALLYIEFLELLIERTLKKLIINFKIE